MFSNENDINLNYSRFFSLLRKNRPRFSLTFSEIEAILSPTPPHDNESGQGFPHFRFEAFSIVRFIHVTAAERCGPFTRNAGMLPPGSEKLR